MRLQIFFSLLLFVAVPNRMQGAHAATAIQTDTATDDGILQTAKDAYIFGYPLVMMELTRRVMTNFEMASSFGAPMNQFSRKETFPDEKFTAVPKPNCDTYSALAWLNLSNEPLVMEIPNTKGRYFLVPVLDAWTNVIASPGKRTTGTKAQAYLITGPAWKGKVPKQLEQIHSPTNMAWISGRTQVNSEEDGATVVKTIQSGYRLIPFSSYNKQYAPPAGKVDSGISMMAPVKQIYEMPAVVFFNLLNKLMVSNPPFVADSAILKRMKMIGIAPGDTFEMEVFSTAVQDSIKLIPGWCKKHLADIAMKHKRINGWMIQRGLGDYGTRYEQRALIAGRGLGANLDEDAIYPSSVADADGEKYDGAKHNYVLHFDAGKFPPANAFWSLTMYNMDNFLVANPINRFAIGDRNELQKNPDGSIDIYIQKDDPGQMKGSNWLPAPAAPFNLLLRIFWPQEAALDNCWIPPAVQKNE